MVLNDEANWRTIATGSTAEDMLPLCVDLDGTLLVTDSLHETFLAALAQHPWSAITAIASVRRGKATLKRRLAQLAPLDPRVLPYNEPLLSYLRDEKAKGRDLALVSAADQSIVTSIADHLGIFDCAIGSDGTSNLSGTRKLAAIRERYGDDFAYVGNAEADLAIWRKARAAMIVGDHRGLVAKLERSMPITARFPASSGGVGAWCRALRLHQWTKNALIFVPVLLAGPLAAPPEFVDAALGFVVFGLLASSGYVINDLLDLSADRRHPTKRARPFAAGLLSARSGALASAVMLSAAAGGAALLGWPFAFTALGYFFGTVIYSIVLKTIPMLDVLVLAGLFTVRVAAGTTLTAAPFSYWLMTFSMLLFFSLALVKRYAELSDQSPDDDAMLESRGYSASDLALLLPFGAASAVAAGLLFVIYLVDEKFPSGMYTHPVWLWFIFPLLMYWLLRIWRLVVLGRMNQDPVLFAVKDRVSLILGGVVLLLLLLAR